MVANVVGVFSDRVNFVNIAVPTLGILAVVSLARVVVRFRGLPNEHREVAAGYTTLARSYPDLDQVEPEYGRVVRGAGEPYLSRSHAWFRAVLVALVLAVALALGLALLAFWGHNESARMHATFILTAAVVIVPALVIAIWAVRFVVKRNVRAALSAYPTAVFFLSERSQDLLRGLRTASATFRERELAVGFPLHFVVAADGEGVHLVATSWRPFETIHWGRIEAINLAWVSEPEGLQLPAVELHVAPAFSGVVYPVRLTVNGARTSDQAEEAVAVLEEIRRSVG